MAGCISLENINCYNNSLTSIDISECSALKKIMCDYNPLKIMYVKDKENLPDIVGDRRVVFVDGRIRAEFDFEIVEK